MAAKTVPQERKKITMLIADMLPLAARVDGIVAVTSSELVKSDLEHIPDAELKVFKTGGHLLVSHGTDVQTKIAEFLSERVSHAAPISDGHVSRNLSEAVVTHCMPPLNYGVRRLAKASRLMVSN